MVEHTPLYGMPVELVRCQMFDCQTVMGKYCIQFIQYSISICLCCVVFFFVCTCCTPQIQHSAACIYECCVFVMYISFTVSFAFKQWNRMGECNMIAGFSQYLNDRFQHTMKSKRKIHAGVLMFSVGLYMCVCVYVCVTQNIFYIFEKTFVVFSHSIAFAVRFAFVCVYVCVCICHLPVRCAVTQQHSYRYCVYISLAESLYIHSFSCIQQNVLHVYVFYDVVATAAYVYEYNETLTH